MLQTLDRRELLNVTGAAVLAGGLGIAVAAQESAAKRKIVGLNASPRKGKTTAAAVRVCLDAAREFDPELETELIELADFSIPAQVAAGQPLRSGEVDDFPKLVEKLSDPAVAGIVVGSPVYFGNMTALCKAFIDRCGVFRAKKFALRNKVAGVLAVGSARNGGQELTIRSIQTALLCQEMIVVGDGQPSARIGGTLWSQGDSIADDQFGNETVKNLGRRIAELVKVMQ